MSGKNYTFVTILLGLSNEVPELLLAYNIQPVCRLIKDK